jgi:gluconolactonase
MTGSRLVPLASGFALPEAARWYDGALVFSDMTIGGVYRLRPGDGERAPDVVIPHRKGIGGLVAHRDGGFVVSGRNVALKRDASAAARVYLEPAPDEQFFNDLIADSVGRLYVGSVAKRGPSGEHAGGRLYRIDLDGSISTLSDDVLTSNGLGIDPSGRFLYHVDSPRRTVWRFDLGRATPTRERFADTSVYGGLPDGLAVAADGSVWVAQAGGGVAVAWDADGQVVDEIAVPRQLVTSVCFGGPNLTDLYVLAGVDDEHPHPDGGAVYRLTGSVRGLPAPVAAIGTRAG